MEESGMTTASESETVTHTEPARRLRGWALATVLASLLLSNFLSGLDQIIVETAIPRIIGDLQGFDRYTWVITAYLLCFTAMVPIAGKLSDQFGRKWLLMGAITLFLASSALGGASQTMNQLIVFRGLQGLSAGAIQTLVSTVVADIFSPAERPRWQGLFVGVFALASVVGPTLGGWITDNLGWRWVFYINVPLVPLALIALFFWLPAHLSMRSNGYQGRAALRRIDVLGAASMAGATVCLLLGLTWGGQTYPWGSPQVIGVLVGAGVLFVVFVVNERFAVEPILPLRLARNQVFTASALLSLTTNMALLTMLVYIPLYIQGVLGQSATSSGAFTTPLTLTIMVSAILSGVLVSKTKRYQWVVVLGCLVLAFGAFLMTGITPGISPIILTRNMMVIGLGIGMSLPILTTAVQNAIPQQQLGAGTGAVSYLRSLGGTLGVATIGTVVSNTFASELGSRLPQAAKHLPQALLNAATNQQVLVNAAYRQEVGSHLPAALFNQMVEATRQTLAAGIEHAFWVALGICALALVISLFLKDVPLRKQHAEFAEIS
jgi:EmrB/QacA subfamily drug resistance transporter